ncbi:MAG TPA: hypothetical protein VLA25_04395, partial [Methylotenera sp.]|nr:hypothetical protein [Methylotenera sp.]
MLFNVDLIAVTLIATLQQLGTQTLVEPIANSLGQFGQTVAEAAPRIIAALILLGIGLLV